MKSLCGLSLWTKDCRAETAFQRDRKRERQKKHVESNIKICNADGIWRFKKVAEKIKGKNKYCSC